MMHREPPAAASRPLLPFEEARAFWRLRGNLARNLIHQTLQESRLRVVLVVLLSGVFWLALFWLFSDGFRFMATSLPHVGTRVRTVSAIFNLFFLSLFVMLIFSSGIIIYGGLFRSREIEFLLTLPARHYRVFAHKFQEAVLFSSWGFLLLGTPMLVAYGLVDVAPWYYFAMIVPFMLAFIHIPCTLGAIGCLCVVRWLPRRKSHVLGLATAAVAACVALAVMNYLRAAHSQPMTPAWFQEILSRMQFSEQRLLPSWWLTSGLLQATEDDTADSVLFLTLLISNALFFHQLAIWTASGVLRGAFFRSRETPALSIRVNLSWIDRAVFAATAFLPKPMRLLIVNDLRLFRRDPVQWSQFLIFFGLLALYFVNIRRLSYDLSQATWVNIVSFLNLSVVGLILSTFTSRFVYPMISLEGRRFWILGRLPIARRTILWSKFLFASLGSLLPCLTLVFVSDLMLGVLPAIMALHLLTCVALCLGLSALAVGMGAKMPNLRETSPSKIAAGFGGTLNLVISTAYIVAIVLMTALPCHFYLGAIQADPQGVLFDVTNLQAAIVLGTIASVVLCVVATVVPLRIGIRAFDELEF